MGRRHLSHRLAWSAVTGMVAQPRVDFLAEPDGIDLELADLCARRGSSSDAYLAAFARAGRHRFATFDRGFRRFIGLDLQLLDG